MSTYVLFFGGYKATANDVKSWTASAGTLRSDVNFEAYAWPSGASAGGRSAVAHFKEAGSLAEAIEKVEKSSAELIYLVGHSSGCAISNAVDHGLKTTANVVLVALDGFAPNRAQLARPSTQVWAAVCGKVVSRNHKDLSDAVGSRLKVYKATDCFTSWALHFSVVNAAATDTIVQERADGYLQCRANLMWLPPAAATPTGQKSGTTP